MDKKFELTDETLEFYDITLHRIKALKDFGYVKKGSLGGWVEKEENLSQDGDCWIYDNAKVYDIAQVYDNALVCDNALACGYARVGDNAIVCDNALVCGNAEVVGNALVYDNAQIYGDAVVRGNAQVGDNAQIYGDAEVRGNAQVGKNANIQSERDYLSVVPVGSRDGCATFYRTKENDEEYVGVKSGRFAGTLDEFERKVEETHGDNAFGKQYKILIEFARVRIGKEKENR